MNRRTFLKTTAAGAGVILAPNLSAMTTAGSKPGDVSLSHYTEPARALPILGEWDVVVCGGGSAGCAAAVAAARHGAKTLILERDSHFGGTTVSALVNVTLSTNGVDFQGIWHEWAQRLRQLGGIAGLHWENRENTRWLASSCAPEMVKLVWDALITESGAEVLHFAWAAAAIVENGEIRGVIVETKGGRQAIRARRVIDCTGDGDVCAAAGASFENGIDGKSWTHGVSVNALLGGVETPDNYAPGTFPRSAGTLPLFQRGLIRFLKIDPLNPWDLTRIMREGRQMSQARVMQMRAEASLPAPQDTQLCKGPFVATTATMPGIRASRRIHGKAEATGTDAFYLRKHPDGIARSSWEIDFHQAEQATGKTFRFEGKTMDLRSPEYRPRQEKTEAGDWFDIRYGCLLARNVENLLMAGRCISCDPIAHASLRIQQTCMSLGQAAGTAAAMSIRREIPASALAPDILIAQLAADRAEVKPAFECLKHLPASA